MMHEWIASARNGASKNCKTNVGNPGQMARSNNEPNHQRSRRQAISLRSPMSSMNVTSQTSSTHMITAGS
jgi:hypothetical protein